MIRISGVLLSTLLLQAVSIDVNPRQRSAQESAPADPRVQAASKCEASGTTEIRIDCAYASPMGGNTLKHEEPRIRLNHAAIAFKPTHESQLRIELTFTNNSEVRFAESRTVYIAFDDEAGENHIRRPLPHVDLQKLVSGAAMKFTDQFLAPALTPGHYFVRLWIPDVNPTLKFDPAHNYLLDNEGMAESSSRLNRIATISIKKAGADDGRNNQGSRP